MATINMPVVLRAMEKALPSIENLVYYNAVRRLERQKRDFLEDEFDTHPVVVELGGGNPETNASRTLDYGNLFSLLGFYKGKDLISPIRKKFQTSVWVRKGATISGPRGTTFNFSFPVNIPTMAEFEDTEVAPRPPKWDPRSWIRILEEGIPYIAIYIFNLAGFPKKAGSRSTTGLQSKGKKNLRLTLGSDKRVPFISNLLKRLAKKFD